MIHFIKQFVRDAGVLSLSLFVAFALFMGVAILEAAFTEPSVGPTGGNPSSPVDTGPNFQTKTGDLRVRNLFVDQLGASGKYVSAILEGRERYQLTATRATANFTVPLNMPTVYKLCRDEDGCRVTMGVRDYAPLLSPATAADRPGLTASRGPIMLFISETSNWWRTSPQGFDPFVVYRVPAGNTGPDGSPCPGGLLAVCGWISSSTIGVAEIAGAEGRDGSTVIEKIFGFADCSLTDGEYTTSGNSDLNIQFGLLNWNGSGRFFPTTSPLVCLLEIED